MTQLPRLRHRILLALLASIVALSALTISACGSSGSPAASGSASPVKTAIVKVMPRDAAVEPPWNGRFVQVNIRVAQAGAMDPADWHVWVNGKEPKLEKGPSILPFSSTGAVVAFQFQTPYIDLGTYDFKVAYTPKAGQGARTFWTYKW